LQVGTVKDGKFHEIDPSVIKCCAIVVLTDAKAVIYVTEELESLLEVPEAAMKYGDRNGIAVQTWYMRPSARQPYN
jgi:hypothetical protein